MKSIRRKIKNKKIYVNFHDSCFAVLLDACNGRLSGEDLFSPV